MVSSYAALALLSQLWYWFIPQTLDEPDAYHSTCLAIQRAVSPHSQVFYPGCPSYANDTHHWTPSSSQTSACSVEPGTVHDVSKILKILGTTLTPFAVKSGGHATNPGFSSTPGVQIALSRFNAVMYDQASNTATIGAGLTWDTVYSKLEPFGVTVVGGRVVGVGVGGVTLGGGKDIVHFSDSFPSLMDTVVAFELVLPDGEITMVTAKSNPELSFALRGGYNNFGIVTNFVFNTFSLGPVWGGLLGYSGDSIDPVVQAVADFQASNTDVDATVVAVFTRDYGSTPIFNVGAFYNGSTPPPGLFDKFFAIPRISEDVKTRTYPELISVTSGPYSANQLRGAMHTVSLSDLSVGVISQILNQTNYYAGPGSFTKGSWLSAFIEPLIPNGAVTSDRDDTAFPHDKFLSPLGLQWLWPDESSDSIAWEDMKLAAAAITATAQSEGQQLADVPLYSNYALADVPLHRLYSANLPRLRRIKMKYDPLDIMGLAGGYRF